MTGIHYISNDARLLAASGKLPVMSCSDLMVSFNSSIVAVLIHALTNEPANKCNNNNIKNSRSLRSRGADVVSRILNALFKDVRTLYYSEYT